MLLASLLACFRSRRRAAAPRTRSAAVRPALEALEDRTLCSVAGGGTVPAPLPGPVKEAAAHSQGAANVVFLGDSIFARFQHGPGASVWKAHVAPLGARDLAVPGATTESVLLMVRQGLLNRLKPRAVVLLVGSNNFAENESPADVAAGIATDVGAIRARVPKAGIVLVGLLPRAGSPNDPMRWEIPQVNQILSVLGTLPRIRYVDASQPFKNSRGTGDARLLPDTVDPNTAGYQLLFSRLRGALGTFLGKKVR